MRILLFATVFLFSFQLSAQDCLPGWAYYSDITIDNSTGNALSDYQVRLEMNTGALVTANKLNADGSDLRFVDTDCNLIHYFMDSLATNEQNVIWLKIPELAAGSDLNIQVYYGNSDAMPYANGDSTFIFFDDFESGVVDLNKWEPIGGYATLEVVDGVLNYASDGSNPGPRFKFVRTAMDFSEPVIFDFAAQIENSNGFGFSSHDETLTRILFRQSGFGFDTLNQVALMLDTISNGFSVSQEYPIIRFPRDVRQDATIIAGVNSDDNLQLNLFGSITSSSVNTDTYVLENVEMTSTHFIVSGFLSFNTIYLDYLRVRSLPLTFPNPTIGPEQMIELPNVVSELFEEAQIQVYPNPAYHEVLVKNQSDENLEVWLYNALGQSIAQLNTAVTADQETTLDISDYNSGVYWLVFRQESNQRSVGSQKLIIQR